jgi:nitrite reductase (NADH) large subunit
MGRRTPELIVVGNGNSGRKFLASAAKHRLTSSYRIRAIDERAEGPWGPKVRGLVTERETVLAVNPALHVLETASGRTLEYDALVLATGMRSLVEEERDQPPGCFVYAAPTALDAIRNEAEHCRRAVVVGGGRHGLKAAQMLRGLGLRTHIVESASRLLPAWVDDTGALVLQSRIAKRGVEVHLGLSLRDTLSDNGRLSSMRFSDGSEIACDLAILCPRARARDDLGRVSGLKLGDREGIAIDERCQTSDPDVFAVGGVASFKGHCLNWPAARRMTAETAARVIAGERAEIRSLEPHASFRVLGIDVATLGDAFASASDTAEISLFDSVADTYARLATSQNGTKLVGGMLVGNVSHYGELLDHHRRGALLPKEPGYLLRMLSGASPRAGPPSSARQSAKTSG